MASVAPFVSDLIRIRRRGGAMLAVFAALTLAGVAAETPAPGKSAADILNRWLEALGGARKIAALKTVDYHCRLDFGAGLSALDVKIRADAYGRYIFHYELPRYGRLTQAFDGHQTWERNAELGFGTPSAQEHGDNLAAVDFRAPARALRQFPQARRLADETVAGRRLEVLEMAALGDEQLKWFFDPATGFRVRIEYRGPGGLRVVEFEDFHTMPGNGGIQEPFRTVRSGGGRTEVVTLLDVSYDDEIDPELFAVPSSMHDDAVQIERIIAFHRQLVGEEALRKVRTRVTRQVTEVTTSGQKITATVSQKRPNLMVMEEEVPGMGTEWQGFDGTIGWVSSELQGYHVMRGAELQQTLGFVDLDGPLQLGVSCPLRRLLEERQDGDRRIVGVSMATLAGPVGNFYFDTATFDLVRLETFMQAGQDGQLKVVADFGDFRKVDGVVMPFRTVITNPAMRMVTTLQSVQDNVPLDDAIFKPRKE